MKLYLRDIPVLGISENGNCKILDFDRLPFALRKEDVPIRNLSSGRQTEHYRLAEALQKKYLIRCVCLRRTVMRYVKYAGD